MSKKEIMGFNKPRYHSDSDSICPNCGHKEWIGLTGVEGVFVSKRYNYYTCSKCRCQWKIRRSN